VLHRSCCDALERGGAWPLALRLAPWRQGAALLHQSMAGMAKRGRDAAGKMAPLSKWVKNQQLDSWNIPTHI
jgi:hypothetical protein